MTQQCDHCQSPFSEDMSACPECGQVLDAPAPEGAAPSVGAKPLKWERKPFADAAVTQFIEIPPGGFPPPSHPMEASAAPLAAKSTRAPILLAICLGLLAGLFVILLIVGITSLRRAPAPAPGAAVDHGAGQ